MTQLHRHPRPLSERLRRAATIATRAACLRLRGEDRLSVYGLAALAQRQLFPPRKPTLNGFAKPEVQRDPDHWHATTAISMALVLDPPGATPTAHELVTAARKLRALAMAMGFFERIERMERLARMSERKEVAA